MYFEPASNSVRAITADIPDLGEALASLHTEEDCVRKLGRPSRRIYDAEADSCCLVYEQPEGKVRLFCNSGKLVTIAWGPDLRTER